MGDLMAQLYYPRTDAEKKVLLNWCVDLLPMRAQIAPSMAQPVGVVSDDYARLYAVAVWHNYIAEYGLIELTAASKAGAIHWGRPSVIRDILRYPFQQIGIRKMVVHIAASNRAANAVAAKAGLTREATLRHHYANKQHAVMWSMTAHEWRQSRWFVPDEQQQEAA